MDHKDFAEYINYLREKFNAEKEKSTCPPKNVGDHSFPILLRSNNNIFKRPEPRLLHGLKKEYTIFETFNPKYRPTIYVVLHFIDAIRLNHGGVADLYVDNENVASVKIDNSMLRLVFGAQDKGLYRVSLNPGYFENLFGVDFDDYDMGEDYYTYAKKRKHQDILSMDAEYVQLYNDDGTPAITKRVVNAKPKDPNREALCELLFGPRQ